MMKIQIGTKALYKNQMGVILSIHNDEYCEFHNFSTQQVMFLLINELSYIDTSVTA